MLTYRNATPADLPFIIALVVEDSVIQTGDDPADAMHADYVQALAEITDDPGHEMIVVDDDGEPVGCFQLSASSVRLRLGLADLLEQGPPASGRGSHRRLRSGEFGPRLPRLRLILV